MATDVVRQRGALEYERPRHVPVDEYLRLSAELPGTYEYHHGLMYPRFYPPGSHEAMAGGTRAHARLIVRMVAALEGHLRGGPCNVYPSDVRLYVAERSYFYPDAFAVCNVDMEPNRIDQRDALLVTEVHSASTSDFDHGDKFEAYRQLPSMREYLLLDNRRIQATVFRRGDDGEWRYRAFVEGSELLLESLGMHLPLHEIYESIPLDRDEATAPIPR